MTAQKNTDTTMGAAVGGNLLNKLNLPGLGGAGGGGPGGVLASMQGLGKGGYQPKMFGAKAGDESGNTSERSFTSRFGAANQVSASVAVPSSQQFLAHSVQGSAANVLSSMARGPGGFKAAADDTSDTSSQRVYQMPGMRNPQSRKSVLEDEDTPNTDEVQ